MLHTFVLYGLMLYFWFHYEPKPVRIFTKSMRIHLEKQVQYVVVQVRLMKQCSGSTWTNWLNININENVLVNNVNNFRLGEHLWLHCLRHALPKTSGRLDPVDFHSLVSHKRRMQQELVRLRRVVLTRPLLLLYSHIVLRGLAKTCPQQLTCTSLFCSAPSDRALSLPLSPLSLSLFVPLSLSLPLSLPLPLPLSLSLSLSPSLPSLPPSLPLSLWDVLLNTVTSPQLKSPVARTNQKTAAQLCELEIWRVQPDFITPPFPLIIKTQCSQKVINEFVLLSMLSHQMVHTAH